MKNDKPAMTALQVKALAKPGKHAVGGSLYLVIDGAKGGGRRWVWRSKWAGKVCDMPFGSAASGAKDAVRRGVDPRAERKAAFAAQVAASEPEDPAVTFGAFADDYLASKVEDMGARRQRAGVAA